MKSCCLCGEEVNGGADRKVSEAWAKGKDWYLCEPCQEISDKAADEAGATTARIIQKARAKLWARRKRVQLKLTYMEALQARFGRWKLFSFTASKGYHEAGDARGKVYEALLNPEAQEAGEKASA
jgi:hypothetical protein